MNLEEYANPQAQKYKLIVAVAVLNSKPANLTVSEYIEKLRNGIKKETIRNSEVCDGFEINHDSTNTQDKNKNMNLTGAMQPLTLDRCIDLADRPSHSEGERAESPSILERFTQKSDLLLACRAQNNYEVSVEKMMIHRDTIGSKGVDDNVDSDKTFCPDSLNYDRTQIYTVPDDLEIIPCDNSESNILLNRFLNEKTNRYDDENVKGYGTNNFEEGSGVRQSRVEMGTGSNIESEFENAIRKGSENQKTICGIGLSQDATRVDSQKTVCETQLSQDSTQVDSQKTICESQLSQESTKVDAQKTVCESQMYKDSARANSEKTEYESHFLQLNTGAIKKKCESTDKTKNFIKSTCNQRIPTSQKFSDSVIENSQNTNDRKMTIKIVKRRNLKRPLDQTNKSSSKVKFKPLENGVIAVSKVNLDKNIDKVQNEFKIEGAVSNSIENDGKTKVEIMENIVIRKATTTTSVETNHKTDAKVSSSELENDWNRQAESIIKEDRIAKERPSIITSQIEDRKYGSENVENLGSQEERLEDYSRIIKDAERDRTPDRLIYAGFPSMDVYSVRGNENDTNTGTGVQNVERDEDLLSIAGRDLEASERGARKLTLTIFEVMHKARYYIDREKSKGLNSFSGDSGYGSEWRSGSGTAEATIDHTGTALYKYLLESSIDVDDHTTCGSVSEVLGELVDRLDDEDNRPTFLAEMLDKTTALSGQIFDATSDHDQVRREENLCIFLFLNTSLTILTHTLEKMVQRVERLHENLFNDTDVYEISNLEKLENQCYLFHVLEILLKRYLVAKDNRRNKEANLTNSSSSTRSSMIEVWKSKWCPDHIGRDASKRFQQERTCCIWKYREILGKIIHGGVRSYSLVSFAALQCYNLLYS